MAKGPKGFSDVEKVELKKKLCEECEKSWSLHGYKKTSIGEVTAKIGISTGAFYLLYAAKEDLFVDTLANVQTRLKNNIYEIVEKEKGKKGFIQAMKWHFQEYDKAPFLYDLGSPDFLSFLNKLPQERIELLKFDSTDFFHKVIETTNLTLKVKEEKAYAIMSALLYTVTLKDKVMYNHFEIFETLLDGAVDQLFV